MGFLQKTNSPSSSKSHILQFQAMEPVFPLINGYTPKVTMTVTRRSQQGQLILMIYTLHGAISKNTGSWAIE
jgi:hypothetical protein